MAGSWQSPVWGGGAETYLPVCVHRQEEGVGVLLREGKERGGTLGPAWPRGSRGSGGSAWSRLTCCVPGSRLMLTKATQGLPSSGQVKCLVDKPTSSYSDQLYLLIENVEMSILQVGRGRLREADSPGQKVVRTLEPNPCSGSLCPAAPQRSDRGGPHRRGWQGRRAERGRTNTPTLGMGKLRPSKGGAWGFSKLHKGSVWVCSSSHLSRPACFGLSKHRGPLLSGSLTQYSGSRWCPSFLLGCKSHEGRTPSGSALPTKPGLERAPQTQTELDERLLLQMRGISLEAPTVCKVAACDAEWKRGLEPHVCVLCGSGLVKETLWG